MIYNKQMIWFFCEKNYIDNIFYIKQVFTMKLSFNKSHIILSIVMILWWYFLWSYESNIMMTDDKIWNIGGWWMGFYKIFDYKQPLTLKEMWLNAFEPWYGFSPSQVQGLAYCKFIGEWEKELPKQLWGWYVQLWDKILYEWVKITTCKEQCMVNEQLPYMLYDGTNTYYNGEILSGFDYNNFLRLDNSDMIFSDKQNVYIWWRIFSWMDYMTYKKINQFTFQDKNYTYKIEQAPFDGKYNNKIVRTENK